MSKNSLIYLIEADIIKLNSFLKEFNFTISLENFNTIDEEQFIKLQKIIKNSLSFIENDKNNLKHIIKLLKLLNIENLSFILDSIELIINGSELFLF